MEMQSVKEILCHLYQMVWFWNR